MIFVMDRFTPSAFGLTTAVKEFSAATDSPKILARQRDPALLAGRKLRAIGILAALFGRDRAWHIDDMFAPFCLVICTLGLLSGRRIVICPHGMLDRWALRNGRTRFKLGVLAFLNGLAGIGQLQLHALNSAEARKAAFFFSNARRIEVVANGVPSDILAIRDRFTPHGTRSGPVIVGYMSRITPKKNQMAMVDLAAWLRQHHPNTYNQMRFRIDGEVENAAYADNIRVEIARHSLSDRIEMGKAIAFDARAECLSGYDIFFFPSKSEGMPYVVLEAMALGIPALVSHLSSCGFVKDYGNRVYRTIGEAAAALPESRDDLQNWQIATEAFVVAYGTENLRTFFDRLAR